MKKITGLLLAVLLLGTMLSALALPANADELLNILFEDVTIDSDTAHDFINIAPYRTLTIRSGAALTVSAEITLDYCSRIVIEEGAALVMNDGSSILGESGVVMVYGSLTGAVYSNPYKSSYKGCIVVYPGGYLNVRDKISVYPVHSIAADQLDITTDDNGITYAAHTHRFVNGKCVGCDYVCRNHGEKTHQATICDDCGTEVIADSDDTRLAGIEGGGEGSTLSGGNLTILVGAAAAAVFGLGGFLLGRKKNSANAA